MEIIILFLVLIVIILVLILAIKRYSLLSKKENLNKEIQREHLGLKEEYIQLTNKINEQHKMLSLEHTDWTNRIHQQREALELEHTDWTNKIDEQRKTLKSEHRELTNEINEQRKVLQDIKKDIGILSKEDLNLFINDTIDMNYENISADEIKNELINLKLDEKELVKNEKAIIEIQVKNFKDSKVKSNNIKQLIRCFENESKILIENLTIKNIDTTRNKLQKSFEVLNNIFETDCIAISRKFLEYKLKELNLKSLFLKKQEEEKETKKLIREQLIEEEKVRKEIEKEKLKIEKEEKQFNNEVSKLTTYLQKADNDIEKQLYYDKIKELEEKIKLLQKDKENALQREINTRAGFVYVISNIGSFGEDIFKIGMTRRLEPMDRISELSSASVPFPFDVHTLIFSEDAPALENSLHKYFESKSLNKVNSRKEFFKIETNEIKEYLVNDLGLAINFIDIPKAEQYRESLKILNELN